MPIVVVMYLLERLICQDCKTTYTAAVPGETANTDKLDPSSPALSAKPKERGYDATAAATIASMRFEMGVPHFRLAEILEQQGIPLAPSTQYKVMDEALRELALAVVGELEKVAGQDSELAINDDTRARIMALERQKDASFAQAPPKKSRQKSSGDAAKPERKAVQTSAIVCQGDEHTICLYYTGHAKAGENLGDHVLEHRPKGAPPIKQMCDGLSANLQFVLTGRPHH